MAPAPEKQAGKLLGLLAEGECFISVWRMRPKKPLETVFSALSTLQIQSFFFLTFSTTTVVHSRQTVSRSRSTPRQPMILTQLMYHGTDYLHKCTMECLVCRVFSNGVCCNRQHRQQLCTAVLYAPHYYWSSLSCPLFSSSQLQLSYDTYKRTSPLLKLQQDNRQILL